MVLPLTDNAEKTVLALAFPWGDVKKSLELSSRWPPYKLLNNSVALVNEEAISAHFSLHWEGTNLVFNIPDCLDDLSLKIVFPFASDELLQENAENHNNLISQTVMKSLIEEYKGLLLLPYSLDGKHLSQIYFNI